jgi:hypothetical protein
MKKCPGCGKAKPRKAFYPAPARRGDGLSSYCRPCARYRSLVDGERKRYTVGPLLDRSILTEAQLDNDDRRLRRDELDDLGGLAGVHAIRARMRRLHEVKVLCHGEPIPETVLAAVLPM